MAVIAIKLLICFYAALYGVSPVLATEICRLESDFAIDAIGDQGKAVGLFQFHRALWGEMRVKMGLPTDADLRLDPRENIRTAMFTMSQGLYCRWSTWEIAKYNTTTPPRESIIGARLRHIRARYEGGS